MNRQTTTSQVRTNNSYVVSGIRRYAQTNWSRTVAVSVLAFTFELYGCPSNTANDKKPTAQIVDSGRMGEGVRGVTKPLEKKDVGLSSIVPKKEGEKDLSKPVWIDENTLRFPNGKIVELGKTSDLPSLGTRNPEPVKHKPHETIH